MVYNPNKSIHPGHIISRNLERAGMTQKNLSERTGLTEKHLSQIINGEASITVETALLLENALGGNASFWINLEKNYQETKARIERSSTIKEELPLLSKFPYPELAKRGYVEQTTNKEKKIENLWKFFGVNSLSFIQNTEAVAFRARSGYEIKSEAIAAWLRCGELDAREQSVGSFSEAALKSSLLELKSLTVKSAEDFSKRARDVLNSAGVALVYTPHFPGTGVSGAVRWVGDNPIMQLSLFGSYADMFWFNFFHEIGHLLLHGKKEKFIEFDKRDFSTVQEKEKEADAFATKELIDVNLYSDFLSSGDFSKTAIVKFSEKNKLSPGILAGRLCHEKLVQWKDVAPLRIRLKFAEDKK
jgi:HTH-type transcriptional regulator/antitoxin HigA